MGKQASELDVVALQLVARVGQAIAAKGNPDDPRGPLPACEDSNPYTARVGAYDLGRLISYVGGDLPDWPRDSPGEQIIASMIETCLNTAGQTMRDGAGQTVRNARAQWLSFELKRLNPALPTDMATRALDLMTGSTEVLG